MNYVHSLLTAAKTAQGIPSNYRLARVLGVSDNTLNNWQSGRAAPSDLQAIRLAEMAGIDPAAVLAELAAARAKDDGTRAVWRGLADKLKGGAVAAGVGLFLGVGVTPDGGAMTRAITPDQPGLYIMTNGLRRLMQRLRRTWRQTQSPQLGAFCLVGA